MTAFWVSLFFVMVAEMGDKTQLVALAYAPAIPRERSWLACSGLRCSFTFFQ